MKDNLLIATQLLQSFLYKILSRWYPIRALRNQRVKSLQFLAELGETERLSSEATASNKAFYFVSQTPPR
jgi:hypothetical protein